MFCNPSDQIRAQLVAEPTFTAAARLLVVPSPNWPAQLLPQAQRLPSRFKARLWAPPAATAFQSFPGTERTGRSRSRTRVPSPNCWRRFSPQAQSVPSDFKARE